jgi:hypothetical protein
LDLDLPSFVLPSSLDDWIGGRGSILSIVRATDEIANHAPTLARMQALARILARPLGHILQAEAPSRVLL